MSRGTRIFFTKLTHFFKQHFGSSRSASSSSNDDAPFTGSTPARPAQHSTPSSSRPPIPSDKPLPRVPSPTGAPSQPLTPPASQLQATPPSLQLSPHSVEYGEPSSGPSIPKYHAPQRSLHLALSPPTPGQTTPSLLPGSRAPTPQPREPPSFVGAHDFVIKDSHFIDVSFGRPGLKELIEHSMPDAFHNSAARYPPPKCHLGTRNDYITKIIDWALRTSDHDEPILWMRGPFGIGKSAVAQSCAEVLQRQNKLAATLFFSRSNTDRDDPRRVFTSISYQIAAVCEPFSDIVNARVCKDPGFAKKSLSTQFEELLVDPLNQIDVESGGMSGRVVIIDGLDECRGTSEQCEIIRVIAASARDRTTPFRWFITSRPEDPIIRTMRSPAVSSVSFHLELPVSREIDHEILLYLTDEFKKIRDSHGLAESWPSETALALIVDRTAGLWIYVTTITRFITDENSLGPEDQLRIVLAFLKDVSTKVGPDNPLTEMDFFYILIIQRIPLKIRTIIRKILMLHSVVDLNMGAITNILGLPEEQFRHSCASIQSVMELQGSNFDDMDLRFHHASFLDFMKDPKRSKELCISGDFVIECRKERLDWLHQVCSRSKCPPNIVFPPEPVLAEGWDCNEYYSSNWDCFWWLCSVPGCPIDFETTASIGKFQFQTMLRLMGGNNYWIGPSVLQRIRDNLPIELRDEIIRRDKCPTPGCTNTESIWILGCGENEVVLEPHDDDGLYWKNNQDPPPGRCVCGSRIEEDFIATMPS